MTVIMDERQKDNVNSAMAKVLVMVYIAIVIFGVFSFLQNFNIMDCVFELAVAIIVPILVLIFSRNKKKKVVFPMTLAGLAVSPDRTKAAKIERIKAYLKDSLTFAVGMVAIQFVFNLWDKFQNVTIESMNLNIIVYYGVNMLMQFVIDFAVFFIINYIMYEHKSKIYCRENVDIEG